MSDPQEWRVPVESVDTDDECLAALAAALRPYGVGPLCAGNLPEPGAIWIEIAGVELRVTGWRQLNA